MLTVGNPIPTPDTLRFCTCVAFFRFSSFGAKNVSLSNRFCSYVVGDAVRVRVRLKGA